MRIHIVSKSIVRSAFFSAVMLVAACGTSTSSDVTSQGGASGNGGQSGGGSSGTCTTDGTIRAKASNNFSFWSVVKLPTLTKVKPKSELTFDWSALTTDFLTKSLDPSKDVVLVTAALWEITPDQFATEINDDSLGSPAVAAFLQTEGKLTRTGLFTLTPPAGPIPQEQMLSFFDIDVYPPGKNFYTLLVGSDLTPGAKTRMIGGFELSADSTNTEVKIDDNSTKLEYDVDFSKSQPTLIPTGKADLTMDWSGMETTSTSESDPSKLNAAGRPFLKRSIKQVKVARYSLSAAELKKKESFLKIDDLADATFVGTVSSGSKLTLSSLADAKGNAFQGIDGSHTWLLALINTDSKNPAPWYLTFLEGCK
jgi:hypothetical protein